MKRNFLTFGAQIDVVKWFVCNAQKDIFELTYEQMTAKASAALHFYVTTGNIITILKDKEKWTSLFMPSSPVFKLYTKEEGSIPVIIHDSDIRVNTDSIMVMDIRSLRIPFVVNSNRLRGRAVRVKTVTK